MYNEVIYLISEVKTVDAYGDTNVTETRKAVFAKKLSIGMNEFYQAKATGLKPEIKFVIADFLDYAGEMILAYTPYGGEEDKYSVVRTYRNGNELEITCKRGID